MSAGGGSGLVAWPVFKTATEAPPASPVGSIPTRSRHFAFGTALLALAVLGPPALAGQDTTRIEPDPLTMVAGRPVADTGVYRRAPLSPMGAFGRSALVPGWAQAALDRRLTAGLFIAWEGVSLGMTIKAHREARYLKRIGSARLGDKRQEREDWLIMLAFNHLFSGLEAFVATHLFDFPEDVRLRALPAGDRLGARLILPMPRR